MDNKTLEILEYNKLIKLLSDHATSQLGKNKCASLHPLRNREAILASLGNTSDAVSRVLSGRKISFSGNRDLEECFKAMSVEANLDAGELLMIASSAECAQTAASYGLEEEREDSLKAMFEALVLLNDLSGKIRKIILSEDEIADDASPALKDIRREKVNTTARIHSDLNKMVNSTYRSYLQDAVITMRNDRYCIPVKAEYKGNVKGIVHDQSSSGSTLFVEPATVVELNNKLRELGLQESAEIEKILAELSLSVAEHVDTIRYNSEIMTDLDFVFAKA